MNRNLSALTVAKLALCCEITESQLRYISQNPSKYYQKSRLIRVGDKHRLISPPRPKFKKLLRKIHRVLQNNNFAHPCAYGAIKGKSSIDAARKHRGAKYIVTRDVSKAFPSLKPHILLTEIEARGFNADLSQILVELMTLNGEVPHGSPLSTDAINLYLYRFDQKISSISGQKGFRYTRFVDDCVVSIPYKKAKRADATAIGQFIENELNTLSLQVNIKKRAASGFQDDSGRQYVHKLIINKGPNLEVSNEDFEKWYLKAQKLKLACQSITADDLPHILSRRQQIRGWINYYIMVNPRSDIVKNVMLEADQILLTRRIISDKSQLRT
jgi:hypothetical protein